MKRYIFLSVIILWIYIAACSGNTDTSALEGTGTIEAVQVDVSAAVNGQIKNIFVEEGDKVLAGDVLLEIDDTDYRIQQKLAGAGLDAASANLDLLLAGTRTEDIQQAQENVKGAKAAFEKAEINYNRGKDLLSKGSSTQSTYDEIKAAYEISQANYQAAQKVLEKMIKGARAQEIEIVRANKAQSEANLELIEKKISDCIITSPIKGTVTNKLVEKGERVSPNGLVATITRTDSMWITIYIGEKNIGKVRVGQQADITIDSYPGKTFKGDIRYIAEEAEFTPKNIQTKDQREKLVFGVKIMIDNQEGILKSGLPADAVIHTEL